MLLRFVEHLFIFVVVIIPSIMIANAKSLQYYVACKKVSEDAVIEFLRQLPPVFGTFYRKNWLNVFQAKSDKVKLVDAIKGLECSKASTEKFAWLIIPSFVTGITVWSVFRYSLAAKTIFEALIIHDLLWITVYVLALTIPLRFGSKVVIYDAAIKSLNRK